MDSPFTTWSIFKCSTMATVNGHALCKRCIRKPSSSTVIELMNLRDAPVSRRSSHRGPSVTEISAVVLPTRCTMTHGSQLPNQYSAVLTTTAVWLPLPQWWGVIYASPSLSSPLVSALTIGRTPTCPASEVCLFTSTHNLGTFVASARWVSFCS